MAHTIDEHRKLTIEVNTKINPTSTWVMDCTNDNLQKTCTQFMTLADDLQQVCEEDHLEEITRSYNFLERMAKTIKPEEPVYLCARNEIRMECKYLLQMASLADYDYDKIIN